jgi:ketol-acid reductoisomerase
MAQENMGIKNYCKEMKKILSEIQTGKFAKEWINETFKNKQKNFLKM